MQLHEECIYVAQYNELNIALQDYQAKQSARRYLTLQPCTNCRQWGSTFVSYWPTLSNVIEKSRERDRGRLWFQISSTTIREPILHLRSNNDLLREREGWRDIHIQHLHVVLPPHSALSPERWTEPKLISISNSTQNIHSHPVSRKMIPESTVE